MCMAVAGMGPRCKSLGVFMEGFHCVLKSKQDVTRSLITKTKLGK